MINKVKKIIFPLGTFVIVLILHSLYFKLKVIKDACKIVYWFEEYIKRQEYFLGLSYGLSFAFIVFAFLKFREDKKDSLKAAMGGSLWAIVLFFFCFLFGCCSSPMLIMYLNLIGISNLKVPKSVLLLITIIYICIGYFWLIKRASKSIRNNEPCKKIKNEKIQTDL